MTPAMPRNTPRTATIPPASPKAAIRGGAQHATHTAPIDHRSGLGRGGDIERHATRGHGDAEGEEAAALLLGCHERGDRAEVGPRRIEQPNTAIDRLPSDRVADQTSPFLDPGDHVGRPEGARDRDCAQGVDRGLRRGGEGDLPAVPVRRACAGVIAWAIAHLIGELMAGPLEIDGELGQLGDPRPGRRDLVRYLRSETTSDVRAALGLPRGKELGDLIEAEAEVLASRDEPQTLDRSLVVHAIPGRGPSRLEEPGVLVEPEGRGAEPGSGGHLRDPVTFRGRCHARHGKASTQVEGQGFTLTTGRDSDLVARSGRSGTAPPSGRSRQQHSSDEHRRRTMPRSTTQPHPAHSISTEMTLPR
jgi:hypothetical protein